MTNFEKVLNNPENAEDIKKAIAQCLCIDVKTGKAYMLKPFSCLECAFSRDLTTLCEKEILEWLNEEAGEENG